MYISCEDTKEWPGWTYAYNAENDEGQKLINEAVKYNIFFDRMKKMDKAALDMIDAMHSLRSKEGEMTFSDMADELNIDVETLCKILVELEWLKKNGRTSYDVNNKTYLVTYGISVALKNGGNVKCTTFAFKKEGIYRFIRLYKEKDGRFVKEVDSNR